MKRSHKQPRKRRGFTLIEMLVVLAILVLLMSMVGPRILGSRKKADINAVKSQIAMLRTSLESYAIDVKDFPKTEGGLAALVEDPVGDDANSKWDGPYITKTKIPKDPWGNDYQYEYPPSRGETDYPDIWSYGPDGEDNTEDDIISWESEEDEEAAG